MNGTTAGSRPTFGIRIPPCQPIDAVADCVASAEQNGFDVAWLADSQLLWRDVFAAMAVAATRTRHITLASAVTNVETRHPTVVASAINSINELVPGRVILGIGTGDSSVKLIGQKPTRLAAFEASISTMRRLLDGGTVEFGDRSSRLRDAAGSVPVHIAASGLRTMELAGAVADGVLTLAGISPGTIAQATSAIAGGAKRATRELHELELTVGTFCHVTSDIERDAALLKPICLHTATVGGQESLRRAGIELPPPPALPEVYPDMVHAEDWDLAIDRAAKYVTDEMAVKFAREFCLFGTVQEILAKIDNAVELGATGFYLRHVGNYSLPSDLIRAFGEEILPRFRAGSTPRPKTM